MDLVPLLHSCGKVFLYRYLCSVFLLYLWMNRYTHNSIKLLTQFCLHNWRRLRRSKINQLLEFVWICICILHLSLSFWLCLCMCLYLCECWILRLCVRLCVVYFPHILSWTLPTWWRRNLSDLRKVRENNPGDSVSPRALSGFRGRLRQSGDCVSVLTGVQPIFPGPALPSLRVVRLG